MKIENFLWEDQPRENGFFDFFLLGVNHLGNVLQVVTDRKLAIDQGEYDPETGTYSSATPDGLVDYYIADVVSESDYFPFGMLMPNRNEHEDDYRYGFNGMEDDEEVTDGNGQSYDFGARFYNSRVGRWLSVDPKEGNYSDLSPYNFVANSPLRFIDPDGEVIIPPSDKAERKQYKATIRTLKKSAIFREMYKQLESSSNVIDMNVYKTEYESDNEELRRGGWYDPANQTVNWGDGKASTLAQEMFHAYQFIPENAELYEGAKITDLETEGEIATYYIMKQINSKEPDYEPMGSVKEIKFNADGSATIIRYDVLNYSPSPTPVEVISDQFDSEYQEFKKSFVKTNKDSEKLFGKTRPKGYTSGFTDKKAVGLIKLINDSNGVNSSESNGDSGTGSSGTGSSGTGSSDTENSGN